MFRFLRRLVLVLLIGGLALTGFTYWSATRAPIVRETTVRLAGWPAGVRPVRILLASDIHIQGPDMPPERLGRVVEQMMALRPDLILLAGDFMGDRQLATRYYSYDEGLAPLSGLRAPLGVYAVLGNHDHWNDAPAAARALRAAGIVLLSNEARRVGPFALGGLDDAHTDRADLPRTLAQMAAAGGIKLLLSHSPDPFPEVPAHVPLMLAGHTHCGQIVLPLIGPLATASRHGTRYVCGRIEEGGRTLIVGAGIGTSVLPFRLGARPDMWLIEVGGP